MEEWWIADLTPLNGLNPRRLVDEQDTVNPICGADQSSPWTEWGSDWDPNNSVPPMIAILDLQQCYDISSIYLYDGNGKGTFRIEVQKANGDWELVTNYETEFYNQWIPLKNLNVTGQFLRFQKLGNNAQINEISICGFPSDCGNQAMVGDNSLAQNSVEDKLIEPVHQPEVFIFPNPSTGDITIELADKAGFDVSIIDVFGATIFKRTNQKERLEIVDLKSGIYWVNIVGDGWEVSEKLVVQE